MSFSTAALWENQPLVTRPGWDCCVCVAILGRTADIALLSFVIHEWKRVMTEKLRVSRCTAGMYIFHCGDNIAKGWIPYWFPSWDTGPSHVDKLATRLYTPEAKAGVATGKLYGSKEHSSKLKKIKNKMSALNAAHGAEHTQSEVREKRIITLRRFEAF